MFNYFKEILGTHLGNEEGQGMVEYALILVLIAIVVITVLGLIGTNLNSVFQSIADAL